MTAPPTTDALKAKAEEASEFLRLLSSPSRLLLLCHLMRGECSVGEIERDLGVQQPALSQQLAELRRHGLVSTRRQSRSIFYSLADDRTKAVLAMLCEVFWGETAQFVSGKRAAQQAAKPVGGDAAAFATIGDRSRVTHLRRS